MLLREVVNALAIFPVDRFELEPHLLADGAGQESTNRMGLPIRGFHDVLQAGSARPFQQLQDLFGLAPLAGAGRLFWGFRVLGGLSLDQPQLRRPVGQRPATLDSRSLLETLPRDLVECVAIALEHGLLAREFLPTPHNDVGIPRVNLHQPRLTASPLTGNEC